VSLRDGAPTYLRANFSRLTPRYSIIFSTWTTSLDLVELYLDRAGLKHAFLRVDGKTDPAKRRSIFDAFKDVEAKRILLMTTGTGAHGFVHAKPHIMIKEGD